MRCPFSISPFFSHQVFKNRQHHHTFLIRPPGSESNATFSLWPCHRSFSAILEKVRCHWFSWLHLSVQSLLGSSPASLLSGSESNLTFAPGGFTFAVPSVVRWFQFQDLPQNQSPCGLGAMKDHRLGLTLRSTRTQPSPAVSSNNFPEFFAPAKALLTAGPVNFFR